MGKEMFDNNLRQQCESLSDLATYQVEGATRGVLDAIPAETLSKYRRFILTGCGDSLMAANIALSSFRQYAHKFGHTFETMRCIDFARYFTPHSMSDMSSTMLIAISASGSPARVKEAILHARKLGVASMLVTNTPESPAALVADYVLNVNTPSFPSQGPGLRNYYASLTGLFLFSAYFAEVKQTAEPGTMKRLGEQIISYTRQAMQNFASYDDQAYDLMRSWSTFEAFDCVGDDIYYHNASFIRAKFVETAGVLTALTDSENWCHVHYFKGEPEKTPLLLVCAWEDNNHSRILETIHQAKAVGRPIAIISTKQNYDLASGDGVFVIPEAPEGLRFLECLVNFVPGALLASYYSALTQEPYFRNGGVWAEGRNNTIKTSEIFG